MGERIKGRCLWFDVKKGFGFLEANGKEFFAHYTKILGEPGEFKLLEDNQEVEFEPFEVIRDGQKKLQAKDIKVIGYAPGRQRETL